MSFIVTAEHLAAIAGRRTSLMPALAEWMNRICPLYDIDSAPEYCHFLAQACHETDHFKTLREYASGRAYEGRADLGNTQPGDGVRFRGRGIFQTTGRSNYLQLGIKKGRRDLFVNNPELLEQPEYAVWSACEYWLTRRLNDIANHADTDVLKKKYRGNVIDVSPVEYISLAINGGYNGMPDRKKFYAIAQQVLVEEAPVPRGARSVRSRAKGTAPVVPPARHTTRAKRRTAPAAPPAKPARSPAKPAKPAKTVQAKKPARTTTPARSAKAKVGRRGK